jgi:hypothetical protein
MVIRLSSTSNDHPATARRTALACHSEFYDYSARFSIKRSLSIFDNLLDSNRNKAIMAASYLGCFIYGTYVTNIIGVFV